jgi:hypothetical protein
MIVNLKRVCLSELPPLLKWRLPALATGLKDLYSDGGYYGAPVMETAAENGVTMHDTGMTGQRGTTGKLSLTQFEWSEGLETRKVSER